MKAGSAPPLYDFLNGRFRFVYSALYNNLALILMRRDARVQLIALFVFGQFEFAVIFFDNFPVILDVFDHVFDVGVGRTFLGPLALETQAVVRLGDCFGGTLIDPTMAGLDILEHRLL